jgi:hydroxymethylpyrimidine/phosphomethylpyrimidine kinase
MRPVVLVIAGSDSSGGAGLLRDVQVLTRLEVEARCVVTAVTAQTHTAVSAIHHVPPEIVREQMRAALETGDIGAIKIGMLGTLETIEAVIEALPSRDRIPIVLDPVLSSSSGGSLLKPSAQTRLKDLLLPRVTLVTPNLPEAARLLVTASDAPVRLCAARVGGALRGTGCALSSAIAANLALQVPLIPACERAKAYVWSLFQQAAH